MKTTYVFRMVVPGALLLTLAVLFCFTAPVHAQDVEQPTDTPVVVDEAPTQVAPPEGDIPVPAADSEEPTPAEEPTETLADTVAALAESCAVITDSSGEALSLTSTTAQEALSGGDPYFMAGGVYYGFSVSGTCPAIVPPANCTMSGNPIQAAITDFGIRHGTGAITVEAGNYNVSVITIDGVAGLTGLIGAGSTDNSSVSTILTNPSAHIIIQNQVGNFTLSGFRIATSQYDGALLTTNNNTGTLTLDNLVLSNNTHSNGDAISISNQTGNVVLVDVQADRNFDTGATISATGSVTITNSSFDTNDGVYALQVVSTNGAITLNSVSASNNTQGDGAVLQSKTGITIHNSMFQDNSDGDYTNDRGRGLYVTPANRGNISIDNSYFNNNPEGEGLLLYTLAGYVTLSHVESNFNRYGAHIDTCQYVGSACTASGAVTANNTRFYYNGVNATYHGYNFYAYVNGAITVNGMNSTFSTYGYGASLDNHFSVSAAAVTVNDSVFASNAGGLLILSRGAVTLNHVNGNYSTTNTGIYVDNSYGTGTVTFLATLGANQANNTSLDAGVRITSKGAVIINQLTAVNNFQQNAIIDNLLGTAGVTITTANLSSSLNESGLEIHSRGLISLTDMNNSYNNQVGALLDNHTSAVHAGVTIKNSYFSNNGTGLYIYTTGPVTLTNVQANNNDTEDGADIITTTGMVTITGGTFQDNTGHGLLIESSGAITLKNIITNSNTSTGAKLDNSTAASAQPVSITNFTSQNNTAGYGLEVDSHGLVSLTNFDIASNGTADGIVIDTTAGVAINSTTPTNSWIRNHSGPNITIHAVGAVTINKITSSDSSTSDGLDIVTSGYVTISNSNFNLNKQTGISISTLGSITLTNVSARSNDLGYGAYLINNPGTGSVRIDTTGTLSNEFMNNEIGGIYIDTNGAVTISRANVTDNHNAANTNGFGIRIPSVTTGNVTFNYVNVGNHPNNGIYVNSLGTVTMTHVSSSDDQSGTNLYINNSTPTASSPAVTITDLYTYGAGGSPGTYHGVAIYSDGQITIRDFNVGYCPNGYAMLLDNTTGTAGVTLAGNSASDLSVVSSGLLGAVNILTNGPVALSNFAVQSAQVDGISINNTGGAGAVSLTNIGVTYSYRHGIWILTRGIVTLNGVKAEHNGHISGTGYGTMITNTTGTATVTITNSQFNDNHLDGLHVVNMRQITLNTVSANNNEGEGAYLYNADGTGGISVLGAVAGANHFDQNQLINLEILTNGDIILQQASGYNSVTSSGIMLDNYHAGAGTGKVTISNVLVRYCTTGFGIHLLSGGAITLSNTTAIQNGNIGIFLDNNAAATPQPVSLTNVSANNSTSTGIAINTRGNTTLSQVTATYNSNGGVILVYNAGSFAAVTSVSRSTFSENTNDGLRITGGGNVTLNQVTAIHNTGSGNGVSIQNNLGGSVGTVSVLSTLGANTFNDNSVIGLKILTNGAVTLNTINSDNNGTQGLSVDNTGGTGTVTLTGGALNHNHYYGVYILSNGAVTISNIQAFMNGMSVDGSGIYISTSLDNALIQNSQITGNSRYGIWANLGVATLTVKKCAYFGNNRGAPNDNDPNIYLSGGTTLVILR